MDALINNIINQFETGKLTRRKMIETIAVAAMTVYGTGKLEGSEVLAAAPTAEMAPPNRPHLDAILVNHVSYTCPDYRKARDFYAEVMGMEVLGDSSDKTNPQYGQANLMFGPYPYGVTNKDATPYGAPAGTPMSFVIVRSRNPNPAPRDGAAAPSAPAAGGGQRGNQPAAQPESQVTIDHMAYTIANWDAARVEEILKARGLTPRRDTENSFHVTDQDGYDLQICGVGMTAYN